MQVSGSCHCGQIAYEAEVEPERSSICHCMDCQVLTGSAFRVSIPTRAGTFRLLAGSPKVYLKTSAASGTRRRHAFCPNCGSRVYKAETLARIEGTMKNESFDRRLTLK